MDLVGFVLVHYMVADLHEYFPEVQKRTISDIFQPWIKKWGLAECQELIKAIEEAGYCFVDKTQLAKSNAWITEQHQRNQNLLTTLNKMDATNKKIVEDLHKVQGNLSNIDDMLDLPPMDEPVRIIPRWLRRLFGGS